MSSLVNEARPRFILSLFWKDGVFVNSRGFQHMAIGDLNLIREYLDINSVDEIILLRVGERGKLQDESFVSFVDLFSRYCFVPLSVGGGIRDFNLVKKLFKVGADRVVLNSAFFICPQVIKQIIDGFGGQSIIQSIDYRSSKCDKVFIENGEVDSGICLRSAIMKGGSLAPTACLYLRNIDIEGMGKGYDLSVVEEVKSLTSRPLLLGGGAGLIEHFQSALCAGVDGLSAGNLFHFMGDGLGKIRDVFRDKKDSVSTKKQWVFH